MFKYTDDDYCDIYENKICDNCGKCLELDGYDTKAIKIEDIAKTVEENKVLEEEYLKELKAQKEAEEFMDHEEEILEKDEILKRAYEEFATENNFSFDDEEYEDAFDHIDYEENFLNEEELEEMTVEIFPGVRVLKKKKEDNE
ncbi:MAG: hypothetical protein K5986_06600 [Clostridium sp.]|uniref:hypothetical protein n=1 Tax=Clostridium sp. DSM 8431 TaxID=1761781 RepID=UPI0008DF674E|nr:hypothetical protein [Clostridium sp. DSM 8431]MCR4944115.1 hypothetical protein [Clostridium sp.]SFU33011.1 hypothetical protein SAMN04487886_100812 [Clostridium sp. DSM 8431]